MFVISVPQEILQRSVSVEDQRQGALSSRAQSKTTLNELLDTLKLLEEEPERLSEPKCYHKEKYAWIDEVKLPQCNMDLFPFPSYVFSQNSFVILINYSTL